MYEEYGDGYDYREYKRGDDSDSSQFSIYKMQAGVLIVVNAHPMSNDNDCTLSRGAYPPPHPDDLIVAAVV